MQTLAKLAGENAFDLSKQIDSLGAGIKAYPDLGIDEKQVDAVTNISKVITKWITTAYQERAVRSMVREGDPHLQTVLDGMMGLVRYYRKTNENEKNTVLGFFEVEIPFADNPKDRLLATLARAHMQSKTSEYVNAQRKYDEAEKGIRRIATGHRKLFENIDRLSVDEVESMISTFAKDIKIIRNKPSGDWQLMYLHQVAFEDTPRCQQGVNPPHQRTGAGVSKGSGRRGTYSSVSWLDAGRGGR